MKRLLFISLAVLLIVIGIRFCLVLSPALSPLVFKTVVFLRTHIGMHNKVVGGTNGWLFYEPELTYITSPLPTENIDRIVNFNRTLREHGMVLFVVPVPNKIDIYPEKFTDFPAPRPVKAERLEIIEGLEKAGVRVIDLAPPFIEAKNNNIPVFDAFESHWTALGMEVAGNVIAQRVKALLAEAEPASYLDCGSAYAVNDTVLKGKGDLLCRVCSDERLAWYCLPVRRVVQPDGSLYEDDKKSKIMILGDSYVNHGKWWNAQIGAQIARFLGCPTRTYFSLLANTEGPAMFSLKPKMFPAGGGVVVWVFSSRVLQYHLGAPKEN